MNIFDYKKLFDSDYYLNKNNDVKIHNIASKNPWNHVIHYGYSENRRIFSNIKTTWNFKSYVKNIYRLIKICNFNKNFYIHHNNDIKNINIVELWSLFIKNQQYSEDRIVFETEENLNCFLSLIDELKIDKNRIKIKSLEGKNPLEILTRSVCFKYLFSKYYNTILYKNNKDTTNIVLIWNIDYFKEHKELFEYRKDNNLPVYCIERGPLPNTVYIDNDNSIFKTNKLSYNEWNQNLSKEKIEIVEKYINEIKNNKITSEIQNNNNINKINVSNFKEIIFCPLQRNDDTSITIHGDWIKNNNKYIEEIINLSKKIPINYLY